MHYSFNLIDQPWIPCIKHDGTVDEVSLRTLLVDAHNLRAICCETPIMTAAVLPVALALLHRVFGPKSISDWKRLWDGGMFPEEALDGYFARWHERFDLFHPERPFFQVRDERLTPKSTVYLAESIANSDTLFNHLLEETAAPPGPAQAARVLITAQFFRLGGGVTGKSTPNLIDGSLARGVLFFASGDSVFETLALNLVPYPSEHIMPYSTADRPVWEDDDPMLGRQPGKTILKITPRGYLDYLTWQTFHITLWPQEGEAGQVVVPQATVIPVARLDEGVYSPLKRYHRASAEDDWKFLYFSPEKALWRDYHSLLALDDGNVKPPAVVDWLAELAERGLIPDHQPLQLAATSMLADQAKPIFYRYELMPLPAVLLGDATAFYIISQAIADAEKVAIGLRAAVNRLAEQVLMRGGDQIPDKNTRQNLVRQWDIQSRYWTHLERAFWDFLEVLRIDMTEAQGNWRETLTRTARDALAEASALSGTSAAALRGQVLAERELNRQIRKALD